MADHPQRERNMKLPAVEVKGRWFTKYDPQLALDIVERIADGELLSKITAKDAIPLTITKQTFLRWVATVPELQAAYAAAIQLSAHSFEEKAIDKAQQTADKPGSPANVSAASLLIHQYQWSAARRNPTRYSDKGNTQIVVPVSINTTLDLGTGKGAVDVEVPNIYTLNVEEAEFTETAERSGALEATPDLTDKDQRDKVFRSLLRPDLPTIGTQRQPVIVKASGKRGRPIGPAKRVLTPRNPNYVKRSS